MHAIRQYRARWSRGPPVRGGPQPRAGGGSGADRGQCQRRPLPRHTSLRRGFTSEVHQPLQLPMTPGREVAGRVDAIGAGVDPSWSGKRVVAHLGMASGGYAEQALAAVDSLHEVPDGMPYPVAVASIGTGRTAAGILDQSPIEADDIVVVTSAAGGLGVLLIQAAKEAGAMVVGLAGAGTGRSPSPAPRAPTSRSTTASTGGTTACARSSAVTG